jgi:hypothetical protein
MGKVRITKSVTTFMLASAIKISGCRRHVPRVISTPYQTVLMGWQMQIFAVVIAIVYAVKNPLNTYRQRTHFLYRVKNRTRIDRIDNLMARISGPYITI